jgi:hypothetical protein
METLPAVDWHKPNTVFTLTEAVTAFRTTSDECVNGAWGPICELPVGAALTLCGGGFNERTVRVCYSDCHYCVYWRDLALASRSNDPEISDEPVELLRLANTVGMQSAVPAVGMLGQAVIGAGQEPSQAINSRQPIPAIL